MKKMLITGGAGFIGTNLTRALILEGWDITILDNFHPQIHGDKLDLPSDIRDRVTLIVADIVEKEILFEALKGMDAVVHYAAETGTGQSMYDISRYSMVNIQATANLCDYIINEEHQISTIIVASSRAIYGEGKYYSPELGNVYPASRTKDSIKNNFEVFCPETGNYNLQLRPTDEKSKIHPSSFYGITKQVQEQMVLMAASLKKMKGFALRYQNVYGPGQSLKNPYTGILSIFSRLALRNEKINVFEDGLESRDFVYIDDVIQATVKCINSTITGQHVLNVGSGVATSVLEVAHEIVRYLNSKSEISVSGIFREGDIRHNLADLTLAKEVIGFQPNWGFKDGLHQFLDWVLKQEDIPTNNNDYQRSMLELKSRGLLND